MKYRIIAICTIVITIFLGVIFSNVDLKEKRYHQHLEAKVRPEDVVTTDKFATHLPIIKIETNDKIPEAYKYKKLNKDEKKEYYKNYVNKEDGIYEEIKNYDTVNATFEYIQNEECENRENDVYKFKTNIKFRIRGDSSRKFIKKSYSIKFMNKNYADNVDIGIDNMVSDSVWVLNGPCMDKTLVRNYICYNLASEIFNLHSPEVRFCELFINGRYEGLYLLIEEINYNKTGRINITKSDPSSKKTSFILNIHNISREENKNMKSFFFDTYRRESDFNNRVSIKYPSKSMTKEQKDYIEEKYYTIERTIASKSLLDKDEGYSKYIDINSFVDYFIFNEFTMNLDALNKSTYLYSDAKNEKLKFAIWDYNNSFGNFSYNDYNNKFILNDRWWYKYILKDEYFTEKVINRYKNLRRTVLSDEYLEKYIDDTIEYLGPAIDRNYKRWPSIMNKNFIIEESKNNKNTYKSNVDYLKTKIRERTKFLDKNIEYLRYYSHRSKNK